VSTEGRQNAARRASFRALSLLQDRKEAQKKGGGKLARMVSKKKEEIKRSLKERKKTTGGKRRESTRSIDRLVLLLHWPGERARKAHLATKKKKNRDPCPPGRERTAPEKERAEIVFGYAHPLRRLSRAGPEVARSPKVKAAPFP